MSSRVVTAEDVAWIVHGIRRHREATYGANTWDEAGIVAKVKPLVGQDFTITVERCFRHAADPEAKTPGAILRPFLPPSAEEKPKSRADHLRRPEQCGECGAASHPGRCAGALDPGDETSPDLPPWRPKDPDKAARLAQLAGGGS